MSEALKLAQAFAESRPQSVARALEEMPSADAARFLAALPAEVSATVIEEMSPGAAARRLAALEPEQAGAILGGVDGRSCGALLRASAPEARRILLRQLPARRVRHFRRSLAYTLDVVGAWIDYDVPAIPAQQTAADALSLLRRRGRVEETQVFVYGAARRYTGAIALNSLLRASPGTELSRLVDRRTRALADGSEIDEVDKLPEWDHCTLLPVTAPDGSLLGGLSRSGLRRALSSVFPDLPPAEPESLLAHLFAAYLRTGAELTRLLIGRTSASASGTIADER